MASGKYLCGCSEAGIKAQFTRVIGAGGNPGARSSRNGSLVVALDDTTDESCDFQFIIPKGSYSGGGLTLRILFCMAAATTGNVKFEASIDRVGTSLDLDGISFAGSQNSGDVAVPGAAGQCSVATITYSAGGQMDSLADGELFILRVTSKVPTGTKATGDRQIVSIWCEET